MIRIIIILFPFIIAAFGCNKPLPEQFDINGYKTGQKIDDNWIIIGDDDFRKTKLLQNKTDTTLSCRTVADTIWSLEKYNIDQLDAIEIKKRINKILKESKDKPEKVLLAGTWEVLEFKWLDSINGDKIYLRSNVINKNWFIEISNVKLLKELDSRHDPSFEIRPILKE